MLCVYAFQRSHLMEMCLLHMNFKDQAGGLGK